MALTLPQRRIGRREWITGRAPRDSAWWLRVSRRAMACRFEVTLSGEDAAHVPAAQIALAEASRLDERLSLFRTDSEVALVNRHAAARPVTITQEVFALLRLCGQLHGATGGAFDITSTPLSRCWGFLARDGRVPDPETIDAARASVGMDGVLLDDEACAVRFARTGAELNLGSIGKGYAVERIAAILRGRGATHALVSAGGSSVRAVGGRDDGWAIELTSRAAGPRPFARVFLRDAALGTSGIGEQYVAAAGDQEGAASAVRYGHVIDPRTGWPARGLLSVSVAAPDAALADALATAFLVGGEALARAYCDAHPGTLALLVPDTAGAPITIGSCRGARLEVP